LFFHPFFYTFHYWFVIFPIPFICASRFCEVRRLLIGNLLLICCSTLFSGLSFFVLFLQVRFYKELLQQFIVFSFPSSFCSRPKRFFYSFLLIVFVSLVWLLVPAHFSVFFPLFITYFINKKK
jgi:hypothetical protein